MDEKRSNPDQTLKMSYIAFTPKDVNYDHSSLVKMNHKVMLRCGLWNSNSFTGLKDQMGPASALHGPGNPHHLDLQNF